MTFNEFKTKLDNEHYVQSIFDSDYEGSCPCATGKRKIDGYWVYFNSRCWRVSEQIDDGFQDLHLKTDHPEKDLLTKIILHNLNEQEWYNPYKLVEPT